VPDIGRRARTLKRRGFGNKAIARKLGISEAQAQSFTEGMPPGRNWTAGGGALSCPGMRCSGRRKQAVPDRWRSATLGDVAAVVRERTDPAAVPSQRYLSLKHLDTDARTVTVWGSTDDVRSTTTPFQAGDTLFGRLRPYLRKGALAPFSGFCATDILVLRTLGDVDSGFLALLVLNDRVFGECEMLSAGTRMPRTSAKDLLNIRVLLPPQYLQSRIVDVVGSVDVSVSVLEAQTAAALTLRGGLGGSARPHRGRLAGRHARRSRGCRVWWDSTDEDSRILGW